jgi:hypothetical protein
MLQLQQTDVLQPMKKKTSSATCLKAYCIGTYLAVELMQLDEPACTAMDFEAWQHFPVRKSKGNKLGPPFTQLGATFIPL